MYWLQNTRLVYWGMLASGDSDLVGPLFRTYADALPVLEARARAWWGHGGAAVPEIMHWWGGLGDEVRARIIMMMGGGMHPVRRDWVQGG